MNSRNKGKRGELELANLLKEHGFDARRGQQYSGANGDADVEGMPGIHIECKRVERLNIEDAMAQSRRDARTDEIPVVMQTFGRGSLAIKTAEQGSGLGLPIVKVLIDLHGGGFRIKSSPRAGTEVTITRPAERVMDTLPALPRDLVNNSAAGCITKFRISPSKTSTISLPPLL